MREVFIEVGTQVIFEVLMLIIGAAFAYLSSLTAKTRKLDHVSAAMSELERVVKTVVGDLQQTVVDGLKDASVDGKLSEEEVYDLGRLLVKKATEQLSDPSSKTIAAAGIDINEAIHSIAEAYIAKIKRENGIIAVGELHEAE